MLQLYSIPVSLYCAKTRILLRHKGVEWSELAPPGGYGSDVYKTVVPTGNLPALQDGDLQIGDSEAIAEYLEEAYPQPSALPDPPAARAKCRERSRFHDTRLEPALRTVFPYLPGRAPLDVAFLAGQSAKLSALLVQMSVMLDATPDAGATLTLADCGYPITFAWMDALVPVLGLEIAWPEAVTAYRQRVEALDAVAAELIDYRPKLAAFLDA